MRFVLALTAVLLFLSHLAYTAFATTPTTPQRQAVFNQQPEQKKTPNRIVELPAMCYPPERTTIFSGFVSSSDHVPPVAALANCTNENVLSQQHESVIVRFLDASTLQERIDVLGLDRSLFFVLKLIAGEAKHPNQKQFADLLLNPHQPIHSVVTKLSSFVTASMAGMQEALESPLADPGITHFAASVLVGSASFNDAEMADKMAIGVSLYHTNHQPPQVSNTGSFNFTAVWLALRDDNRWLDAIGFYEELRNAKVLLARLEAETAEKGHVTTKTNLANQLDKAREALQAFEANATQFLKRKIQQIDVALQVKDSRAVVLQASKIVEGIRNWTESTFLPTLYEWITLRLHSLELSAGIVKRLGNDVVVLDGTKLLDVKMFEGKEGLAAFLDIYLHVGVNELLRWNQSEVYTAEFTSKYSLERLNFTKMLKMQQTVQNFVEFVSLNGPGQSDVLKQILKEPVPEASADKEDARDPKGQPPSNKFYVMFLAVERADDLQAVLTVHSPPTDRTSLPVVPAPFIRFSNITQQVTWVMPTDECHQHFLHYETIHRQKLVEGEIRLCCVDAFDVFDLPFFSDASERPMFKVYVYAETAMARSPNSNTISVIRPRLEHDMCGGFYPEGAIDRCTGTVELKQCTTAKDCSGKDALCRAIRNSNGQVAQRFCCVDGYAIYAKNKATNVEARLHKDLVKPILFSDNHPIPPGDVITVPFFVAVTGHMLASFYPADKILKLWDLSGKGQSHACKLTGLKGDLVRGHRAMAVGNPGVAGETGMSLFIFEITPVVGSKLLSFALTRFPNVLEACKDGDEVTDHLHYSPVGAGLDVPPGVPISTILQQVCFLHSLTDGPLIFATGGVIGLDGKAILKHEIVDATNLHGTSRTYGNQKETPFVTAGCPEGEFRLVTSAEGNRLGAVFGPLSGGDLWIAGPQGSTRLGAVGFGSTRDRHIYEKIVTGNTKKLVTSDDKGNVVMLICDGLKLHLAVFSHATGGVLAGPRFDDVTHPAPGPDFVGKDPESLCPDAIHVQAGVLFTLVHGLDKPTAAIPYERAALEHPVEMPKSWEVATT